MKQKPTLKLIFLLLMADLILLIYAQNYCLYIGSGKYPLTGGMIEIQFAQSGNYPLIANSCDLNEKDDQIRRVDPTKL